MSPINTKKELKNLVLKISLLIAVIELIIMFCFHFFETNINPIIELFLDPIILITLCAPIITFKIIKPYILERESTEKNYREAQEKLNFEFKDKENLLTKQKEMLRRTVMLATEKLKESEERYALAAKGANDGLWDWNLKTNKIYYSDRFIEMLNLTREDLKETTKAWFTRIHAEDRQKFLNQIEESKEQVTLDASNHFECEYRIMKQENNYIWVLSRWLSIYDKSTKSIRLVGSQTDITDRKRIEQQLIHDAFHDHLTGLPNRSLLIDRLEQSLYRYKRDREYKFAFLYIDVDDFKQINDKLGHNVGDELLIEMGLRLRGKVRAFDTVSRLGGDEFAMILEDLDSLDHLKELLTRIQEAPIKDFQVKSQDLNISNSISMGAVYIGKPFNSDYANAEEILKDADLALYKSKSEGKGMHSIFDIVLRQEFEEHYEVSSNLKKAISKEEIKLFYQPIVGLKNFEIIGFEALMRWYHPKRGWIPPNTFIPIAEENRTIIELGEYSIEESCSQISKWMEKYPQKKDWFISVNVSGKHLEEDNLVEFIQKSINKFSIASEQLKVEITENILITNPEKAKRILKNIQELGVKLAIDDFGTGYSSLSYLNEYPFDILKIDRAFLKDLITNEKTQNMLKIINTLGHSLGMKTLVEGIESLEELMFVRSLHCDYAQGYYFSIPLPSYEIEKLLEVGFPQLMWIKEESETAKEKIKKKKKSVKATK